MRWAGGQGVVIRSSDKEGDLRRDFNTPTALLVFDDEIFPAKDIDPVSVSENIGQELMNSLDKKTDVMGEDFKAIASEFDKSLVKRNDQRRKLRNLLQEFAKESEKRRNMVNEALNTADENFRKRHAELTIDIDGLRDEIFSGADEERILSKNRIKLRAFLNKRNELEYSLSCSIRDHDDENQRRFLFKILVIMASVDTESVTLGDVIRRTATLVEGTDGDELKNLAMKIGDLEQELAVLKQDMTDAENDEQRFRSLIEAVDAAERINAAQIRQSELINQAVPRLKDWRQCAEQLENWETWESLHLLMKFVESGNLGDSIPNP